MTDDRRLDPRTALLAGIGLFAAGIGVHLAFAVAGGRPTPITLLAVAPPVAVLAYLRVRPATAARRLAAPLLWAIGATALAFLAVQWYSYLPEGRSSYEPFRFDLDPYVRFVVALAATYTAAAETRGRRALSALAVSPLVQLSVPVGFVLLERWFATWGGP